MVDVKKYRTGLIESISDGWKFSYLEFQFKRKILQSKELIEFSSIEEFIKYVPKQVAIGIIFFDRDHIVKPIFEKDNVLKAIPGIRDQDVYWEADSLNDWVVISRRESIDLIRKRLKDAHILVDQFRLNFLPILPYWDLIEDQSVQLGYTNVSKSDNKLHISSNAEALWSEKMHFNNETIPSKKMMLYTLAIDHFTRNDFSGTIEVKKDREEIKKLHVANLILRYGLLILLLLFLIMTYFNRSLTNENFRLEESKQHLNLEFEKFDLKESLLNRIESCDKEFNIFMTPRFAEIMVLLANNSNPEITFIEANIQPLIPRNRERGILRIGVDTVIFKYNCSNVAAISSWKKEMGNIKAFKKVNYTEISSSRSIANESQIIKGYIVLK